MAKPEVQKTHTVVQVRSVDLSRGPGVVGRATRMSGRGVEAFQVGRVGSGGPSGGLGGFGKPIQRLGSGREDHSEVRKAQL